MQLHVQWMDCSLEVGMLCKFAYPSVYLNAHKLRSLAYRAGVTIGITAPSHTGFYSGLSTAFSLGAMHQLDQGAVIQDITTLDLSISHFGGVPSISTQIATLRRLLLDPTKGASAQWFQRVIDARPYSLSRRSTADGCIPG